MDPVQDIKEREELKQQLQQKGTDKEEKHDINQRIIAIDNQITQLMPLLPDPRPLRTRLWAPIQRDPLVTGGGLLFSSTATSWMLMRYYMKARHQFAPYTEKQLIWRNWVFFLQAAAVPNAKRMAGWSAFVVVMRNWTTTGPNKGWVP
jgi:hypothetical protein